MLWGPPRIAVRSLVLGEAPRGPPRPPVGLWGQRSPLWGGPLRRGDSWGGLRGGAPRAAGGHKCEKSPPSREGEGSKALVQSSVHTCGTCGCPRPCSPPCFHPPPPAALQPTPGPHAVTQAPQPAPHLALRLPAGAGSSEDTGGSRLRTASRGRRRRRHHRTQPLGSGTWRDPIPRAGSVLLPRKNEAVALPPGASCCGGGRGKAEGG